MRYLKDGNTVVFPTVSTEALFTTLVIDAYEGLYIGIFDVLGAYLHAKMLTEKQVLIKLREEFLDIMCEVNPECKEYVRYEHGQNVL